MRRSSSIRAIALYVAGSSARRLRSSSSHFNCQTPRRLASGANRSSTSRAVCARNVASPDISERSACVRSASLMSTTRMSSTIASSILRRFSACAARSSLSPESVVARMPPMRAAPATSVATSAPNCASTSSASKVPATGNPSSSALRMESASSLRPPRIVAVPSARSSAGSPSAIAASPVCARAYSNAAANAARSSAE